MEIVLVSCPNNFEGECELINQMFEEGLEIFHLRKPGYNDVQITEFIERIKPLFHPRIKLHSAYGLLDRFRLGGVHIPAAMGENDIAEFKKYADISISTSFHSFDEIKRKNENIDYAFLSPVFDSISKKNYKCGFDHNALKKILPLANTRMIALGGCEAENLNRVKELGFYGAAFLGAVWESNDPLGSYIDIKRSADMI